MKSAQAINFLPLVSTPNVKVTWLLRLTFFPIILIIPILIFILPALLVHENSFYFNSQAGEVIFLLVTYSILIYLSWLIFKFLKKASQKSTIKIEVNDKGIHYFHLNGETSAILYKNLVSSGNPYSGDIYSKSRYKAPVVLCVNLKDPLSKMASERIVTFDTDIAYNQYVGNKRALIGHFIKGITLFRPDLKVSDGAYSNFFIDKQTHRFDKKDFTKTMILATMLVIVVLILINLYMQYRFPG